jgi:hypothetical protein
VPSEEAKMTFFSSGVMPRAVVLTDAVVMLVSLVLIDIATAWMQSTITGATDATDGRMGRYARTHRRAHEDEHRLPVKHKPRYWFALLA